MLEGAVGDFDKDRHSSENATSERRNEVAQDERVREHAFIFMSVGVKLRKPVTSWNNPDRFWRNPGLNILFSIKSRGRSQSINELSCTAALFKMVLNSTAMKRKIFELH